MRTFFNMDNVIFRGISRIGDMFILSFFWVITSSLIFTIGASTTALLSVSIKILRKKDGNIAKDYFFAFKNDFRQATIIWLIMLAVGGVLWADINFWSDRSGATAMIIGAFNVGLLLIYLATLIYVFAVLAVFNNSIVNTIRTAFFMSLYNWQTTIALLLSMSGISYICWVFPLAIFIMLVFGVGAFALIFSIRYLAIFRIYNDTLNDEQA